MPSQKLSSPASDPTLERLRFTGQPLANPASMVVREHVRFTLLTERLLRLEWSENGQFEDRSSYAFPNRLAPASPYRIEEAAGWLKIDSGALQLRYQLDSGRFQKDNLEIRLSVAGKTVTWRPGMPNPGNLRGTRRTLDMCAGDSTLGEGLVSRNGWALHDDSQLALFDPESGWPVPRPEHALQDWYFFGYGHDYPAALQEYTHFGGAVPLIPRYVLGAWWSRYWEYSDQDLKDLVHDFRAHELPLDVLVIDMDWHTKDAWTGYTWNRELFPDPAGFLGWVHEQGLRATLNLHPAQGVQSFEAVYERFANAMGVDPASRQPVPVRLSDPAFVKHYFELLHHPMEAQGVDFWWLDWQQGDTSELEGLDPLPWLNHLHFLDSTRRGQRPMLYSRWGGLGNQRYHIGFSGDTFVVWEALQFQPYLTATAANLAYGWWSHDIGGHMGGATEPELYARWVQFGALSPVLRLHATKDPRAERRPWAFSDEVFQAAKAAFELRYRLVPYIYTLARQASDESLTPCRPMYYENPEHESAYIARYQYYLGDQLIAAPIVFPADPHTGLAASSVWLPPGSWIDYQSLELFQGPGWVRLVGGLQRLPMLVTGGAILPQAEAAATTEAQAKDHLILELFPEGEQALRLYEDDGHSLAYQQGAYEWTPLYNHAAEHRWVVGIGAVEGHCPALPSQRRYTLKLRGCRQPERLAMDGSEHLDWDYDAQQQTLTVTIPLRPKDQALRLEVSTPAGISALGHQHNQKVAAADIKQLLGAQTPTSIEAVLALSEQPGRPDALARLGGPWVQFIEYSTPEESEQQLGHVIVAGPRDGSSYDLEIDFELQRGGRTLTFPYRGSSLQGDQVLQTPFGFDGRVLNQGWQAQVRIGWLGQTLRFAFESSPLFPTVHHWQIAIAAPQDFPDQQELQDGKIAGLVWQPRSQTLDQIWSNLRDPFVVRLSEIDRPALEAGQARQAAMRSTLHCHQSREVILEAMYSDAAQVYLDGQLLKLEPVERQIPQPPFYWQTWRSQKIKLQAGAHQLLIVSQAPQRVDLYHDIPRWIAAAAFLDPQGNLLSGLEYS